MAITGYDGPGRELEVPFDGDPLTIKKVARKKRRDERKAAAKLGITAAQYRKQQYGDEEDPKKAPVPRRSTAKVATFLAKDDFREQLLGHLALPQHQNPEDEHWLGFSLDELQREAPDPKKAAELVVLRVAEYQPYVALEAVVVFRERLIGVGPWHHITEAPF